MIYCVRDADILAHLETAGFTQIGETPEGRAFMRGSEALTIRLPNLDGNIPEILVNDAFDAAGLTPPKWDVFWRD